MASIYTEGVNLRLQHPGIDRIVRMAQRNAPRRYSQYTDAIESRTAYFRAQSVGDMPIATPTAQGQTAEFTQFDSPYTRDYTPVLWQSSYSYHEWAESSDVYNVVGDNVRWQTMAVERAKDADAADFFNLGTTTQVSTPDGVALWSAAHLYATGVFSNIVTGNPALGVTSLADAISQVMLQPSHEGDEIAYDGPYNLVVPTHLRDLAVRLADTNDYPTTNNNDMNVSKGFISRVVAVEKWDSHTAWALVPANGDDNPLKMVNRQPIKVKMYDLEAQFSKACSVYAGWVKAPIDPRRIIYSAGA